MSENCSLILIFYERNKMKDFKIADLTEYFYPGIIFLRKAGYDYKTLSYILLEIINNYPPSDEEIESFNLPEPSDSENIPNDALDQINQIDEFIESENIYNTNDLILRKEYDEFF